MLATPFALIKAEPKSKDEGMIKKSEVRNPTEILYIGILKSEGSFI